LFTLCRIRPAMIFHIRPAMAIGRSRTATFKVDSFWTCCMKNATQKPVAWKLIFPKTTTMII
jgi:hypothetical protein